MSNKMPMVSLDKLEVKLTMKTQAVVHVDKIAKATGLSRASIINGYVDDGLRNAEIQLTKKDLDRIDEIRRENAEKRDAIKAKKGIK